MVRRILFVGMANSPHAARWINSIKDQGWELHFFPVYPLDSHPAHHLLTGVVLHDPLIRIRPRRFVQHLAKKALNFFRRTANQTLLKPNGELKRRAIYPIPIPGPLGRFLDALNASPFGESGASAPLLWGPHVLARLIKKLKPDLIHSLEFQHAGYRVLRAKELMDGSIFPKWLATNWGSDIYHYRQYDDHRSQITRLLKSIDYYSCECVRDVSLAQEMGMQAKPLPVMPNSGGFDLDVILRMRSIILPADRRVVMVKGYQHFAGRALIALDAILACSDVLRDYRIIVYSASPEIYERVEELRLFFGLNIFILGQADHEKILRYFAHARIYLGISISDGISTSMLEAMAMGAFPIQTDTACCDEWFENHNSGFIVPADNVDAIAAKLRIALVDDQLVSHAAQVNLSIVRNRLDEKVLKLRKIAFYNEIFSEI